MQTKIIQFYDHVPLSVRYEFIYRVKQEQKALKQLKTAASRKKR